MSTREQNEAGLKAVRYVGRMYISRSSSVRDSQT